jgi:hypothetical protein
MGAIVMGGAAGALAGARSVQAEGGDASGDDSDGKGAGQGQEDELEEAAEDEGVEVNTRRKGTRRWATRKTRAYGKVDASSAVDVVEVGKADVVDSDALD